VTDWSHSVPKWPVVELLLAVDGTATVNGRRVKLPGQEEPHTELIQHAVVYADTLGRPVRVQATSQAGTWHLIAHPDGDITTVRRPDPSAAAWIDDPQAVASLRRTPAPIAQADDSRTAPGQAPTAPTSAGGEGSGAQGIEDTEHQETAEQAASARPDALVRSAGATGAAPVPPPRPDHGLVAAGEAPAPVPAGGWAISAPSPETAHAAQTRGAGLQASALAPVVYPQPLAPPRRPGRQVSPLTVAAWGLGIVVLLIAAAVTVPHRGGPASAPSAAVQSDHATSSSIPAGTDTSSSASSPTPSLSVGPLTAAPPGYSTTPQWGAAVAAWTATAVSQDGTIVTRAPSGQVVELDPATGTVVWSTREVFPTSWTGPWLTRIDGQQAAALTSATQLAYWALPTDAHAGAVAPAPRTVALPAGAQVSWSGGSPLIRTTGGGSLIVQAGQLRPAGLPAGFRALAADGATVTAAGGTSWVRISSASTAPAVHAIPSPPGVTATLVRTEVAGIDYLLAVWATKTGQYVVLIDTRTGGVLSQGALPARVDLTHAPLARLGETIAVGPLVINRWINRVQLINPAYTVTGMAPGHLYAKTGTDLVDVQLQDGKANTVRLPAGAPVPFAGYSRNGRSAVTVAEPVRDTWVVLSLPAA
jgi:hypothetical protein